jgi:serine/threonine-protein kinase
VRVLGSSKDQIVIPDGAYPRYLPSGHIVYERDGTLFGVGFDLESLAVIGQAVPLIPDITAAVGGAFRPSFDVSRDGSLVFAPVQPQQRTLVWVDRAGREQELGIAPAAYVNPRISPDGHRVVVDDRTPGKSALWLYDEHGRTFNRLTFQEGTTAGTAWTPDGRVRAIWQ